MSNVISLHYITLHSILASVQSAQTEAVSVCNQLAHPGCAAGIQSVSEPNSVATVAE